MDNARVAFEILEPNQYAPIGWKASSGHLVHNFKIYFTCKAQ